MHLIPWTHSPGSETKRKGHVMSKLINIKWKIVNILMVKNIFDNRSTPMRNSFELYVLFNNLSHATLLPFFRALFTVDVFAFQPFDPVGVIFYWALFTVEVFFHLMFCLHRRFVLTVFFTSTFCRWICGSAAIQIHKGKCKSQPKGNKES